ncbi:protein mono-ADP-ribosyltransferase PARP14-like isoform X2 [Dreissena polymorpha]|uniref:protein mono-ADP-ribosyltransferase PARP14-like isoform X2 n=1 Tax=Dreissena polymorpha TaxID=45954 RepID=UPI0022643F19|nr:protein mono-ADP-ribosyltransferase PARP14-like isoform X2 [Dreissena polymorpha]
MAAKNGGKLSAKSLGRIKVLAYDPRRHHIECEATDIDKVVEDSGEDSPEENDKQSGNKLTVLLIQRVPPKTTDEALRLYFEAKHKLEPTTIYRGDAEDAVLMDFQTRIDIRRIEDDCKRFKCCGNELKVDVVPACIWIKVWGYGTDTSIDLLENYFENKRRSDGGTVDNVRFLENEDAAVVTFKFESDARAVCAKSHHTLKEKRLHTVLYHERLFPTRQRVIVIPEPIEKVVDNKTIVQLFSKSDYFEESWKGESKEIFGKLTFVTEQSLLKITLHCNVSPKETDASLKVQTWLSNGKTFLDNKLATIDVESIDIGEKVFKQVREKIGEINVAEPHKLVLKINNTNSSVDIVGERKAVADLRRQIKAIVEEQQYTFERDNRQITEHVALREHEVTLLRHRAVRQSLDASDVDVKIEAEEIKFTGKRPDVQLALNKLDDAKRNMRQVQLTEFQDIVKELLEKEAVRSFVDKEIESTGVTALWKTTSNGVVMFTYSFKNEDIDRVIVRFRSLLRFITVPLSKDEHDGLLSTEGQSFKKSLNDQFDIVISVSDTSLQYACLKKNADEVRTEIEKFLHNFRNQIQFVETHPTKCKVLKKYCATKLNGIAKKNNVKIEQTSQGRRSGFAISGTAECVDKANESMVRLVRNVKQLRLEYKWPGFQKFAMQSSEGHKAIENIEQEEKCIIIVEGQNFQNERKSTEKIAVQLAGGIKLNVLMRGSIFQKQADVIVNSTNRDLDMSKGTMSKQLLKEAGQGIQIECQQKYPKGIRHGEIAVTSPGRLTSYKQIFHVALPRCHGDQDVKGLRKYVRTCMHEADKNGAQTICFPALGTGRLEYPADGVAKTMELTIQNFGQDNPSSSIKKVFIYIHESDEKTKQSFKDHFGSPVAAATSTSDRRSSDGTNAAQLTVYFHKEQSEQRIKNKIERLRRIDEIFLSASLIEKLTEEKMKEVYKIATPNDVKVKCEDNKMKLFGYGKSVVKTKSALQDYLKKLDDGQSASAAVQFPPTWGKMTINDAPKNVPLVAGSTDYTTVASTFKGQYAAANIVQIDRVQNPQLYMQYLAKKKQIEKTCSRPNCEQKLWHGTRTPQIADNICAKGFDRNYNSGASIGVGVYFAVNATMSATGYTAPDALGQRYIFYADVLTGDYTVGSSNIRVPPAKVPGNNLVTYDSTTNNVAAPSVFVIFHDAQAYPTYKITFK